MPCLHGPFLWFLFRAHSLKEKILFEHFEMSLSVVVEKKIVLSTAQMTNRDTNYVEGVIEVEQTCKLQKCSLVNTSN